jgi:hypothetical protein
VFYYRRFQGESDSGKELAAGAIHNFGHDRDPALFAH